MSDVWRGFFASAKYDIGILVYSGLFLAEDAGVGKVLRDRARNNVRVRIALGSPHGTHIARRGLDENIQDVMASKIMYATSLYRTIATEPNVEIRCHDTVLYASIYRADDELMVNTHVYGRPASHSPV